MNNATKRISASAIVAMIALLGGALLGTTAVAKKKGGKKTKAFKGTKAVNQGIPDAIGTITDPGPPPIGLLVLDGKLPVTFNVGKKFKKNTVGKVTVTLQTTGLASNAAGDLTGRITAPDGTTVELFSGLAGKSIGPVTFQPNSPNQACTGFNPATDPPPPPPCSDPDANVNPPYTPGPIGNTDLTALIGVPMKGNWTVYLLDGGFDPAAPKTSLLNTVSLNITPAP